MNCILKYIKIVLKKFALGVMARFDTVANHKTK